MGGDLPSQGLAAHPTGLLNKYALPKVAMVVIAAAAAVGTRPAQAGPGGPPGSDVQHLSHVACVLTHRGHVRSAGAARRAAARGRGVAARRLRPPHPGPRRRSESGWGAGSGPGPSIRGPAAGGQIQGSKGRFQEARSGPRRPVRAADGSDHAARPLRANAPRQRLPDHLAGRTRRTGDSRDSRACRDPERPEIPEIPEMPEMPEEAIWRWMRSPPR